MQASNVFRRYNNCVVQVCETNSIGGPGHIYTFLTFKDYKENYINHHKALAEFFNENFSHLNYKYEYKEIITDYIDSSNIKLKNEIIAWVNKINSGTIKEYVEAYAGESPLCFALNNWLRTKFEDYNKIKYFAGPFSYCLYKYAYEDKSKGVHCSKKFYRKMLLKLIDYEQYKGFIGEVICFPAFTSASDKDITHCNFCNEASIQINNINVNSDIYVIFIIEYNCLNSSYPTPCVNISGQISKELLEEYIFPPFSFFKIERIEEKAGSEDNPHLIYLSAANKKCLIEFAIRQNKEIYYDKNSNLLYSS
jgi:hypothetical protein